MALRDLPSVDALASALADEGVPRSLTVEVARYSLEETRLALRAGKEADAELVARQRLRSLRHLRPRRVVNATGVLLNTNLGRAPLHEEAARAAEVAAREYGNVEFDLESGRRGKRAGYVHSLLESLTGADGALVVNNNAGALLLTLAALAAGLQVIVSRGEMIEIGGSFRLPEIMAASGAWLVEAGTTNRTRRRDYEAAVAAETALVLKVHPSNYRVVGFTEETGYAEVAQVAHRAGLPLAADIGSGLLDAEVPWLEGPPPAWLSGEPAVRQTLAAGADLVMFSGDKLLGGPQAGIVVGRRDLIVRLARHPVARAVRCDGPTLAALAVTLELYADGRAVEIPFWAMASIPHAELEARIQSLLSVSGVTGSVVEDASVAGAGTVPGQSIPTPVLSIPGPGTDEAWHALLSGDDAIVSRRTEGSLVVDLRAVDPPDDALVAARLRQACRS